jgi:hypothetical protein
LSAPVARLFKIYKDCENIDVVSGLNSFHFNNYRDAAFTHFFRDGESLTDHLGISVWETILLESFCKTLKPSTIYIVGNGLGWSALALSLINPDAAVVVIDPDSGVDLVNRIAFRNNLRCVAVRGYSPGDNKAVIDGYLGGHSDLVLIDGLHTNQAVVADFSSLHKICGSKATYFFHDVINFDLMDAFKEITAIATAHDMTASLLPTAPSGMAIVYPNDAAAEVKLLVGMFGLNPAGVALIAGRAGSTMVQPLA